MLFQTNYRYKAREDKAKYVWLKYQSILQTSILDVGADQCFLKNHLPTTTKYWGIGFGDNLDQEVDLEQVGVPFPENSYETVICLDVLEHINNPHEIFAQLCRVSSRYVIISLPNAWAGIIQFIRHGNALPDQHLKFYGLPVEPPEDRHKWFFSYPEAENFIIKQALKNKMKVVQIDGYNQANRTSLLNRMKLNLFNFACYLLKIDPRIFLGGTIWAVLEKTK